MAFYTLSWSRFKALKDDNPTVQIYYIPLAISPLAHTYDLLIGRDNQYYCALLLDTDVTDFETNYQSAALQTDDIHNTISIINNPIEPPSQSVLNTGTLSTITSTADQVVSTYTVTANKTLYLEYVTLSGRLNILSNNSNPVYIGTASLEVPSGTKIVTHQFTSTTQGLFVLPISPVIPIAAGTVIRVVCSPAINVTTWITNYGGYEI